MDIEMKNLQNYRNYLTRCMPLVNQPMKGLVRVSMLEVDSLRTAGIEQIPRDALALQIGKRLMGMLTSKKKPATNGAVSAPTAAPAVTTVQA